MKSLTNYHFLTAFYGAVFSFLPEVITHHPELSVFKFFFSFFTLLGYYNIMKFVGYKGEETHLKRRFNAENASLWIALGSLVLGVSSLIIMGLSGKEANIINRISNNINLYHFAILWLIGLTYNMPLFGKRLGSRNVLFLKPMLISVAWSSLAFIHTTTFIESISFKEIVIYLDIFISIFILSSTADIRDYYLEKQYQYINLPKIYLTTNFVLLIALLTSNLLIFGWLIDVFFIISFIPVFWYWNQKNKELINFTTYTSLVDITLIAIPLLIVLIQRLKFA